MIILDIETTGTDPRRNCILSLGAVDFETGEEFYEECSIFSNSKITDKALEINGFRLADISPGKKQDALQLYKNFAKWARQFPDLLLAGHNVGHLDLPFLEAICNYGKIPCIFPYRTVDLHSVAFMAFRESLKHSDICKKLGLPPEPEPHNALSGARSERDAFKLLLK